MAEPLRTEMECRQLGDETANLGSHRLNTEVAWMHLGGDWPGAGIDPLSYGPHRSSPGMSLSAPRFIQVIGRGM